MNKLILQFAKAPLYGKVKTRLSPALSSGQCLSLHCDLVDYVARQVHDTEGVFHELWFSERVDRQTIEQYFPFVATHSALFWQCQGDLGQRLVHALEETLERYAAVAVIGSDCPFLSRDYFARLWLELQTNDLVIGPANDGGYVALAMKRCYQELFIDIDWGTKHVFLQTLQKAKSLGLLVSCMDSLPDIDRPDDLPLLDDLALRV